MRPSTTAPAARGVRRARSRRSAWRSSSARASCSTCAALFLAERGAKVLGTDAAGWDRPFLDMRRAFQETGDRAQIWDGHFAGREREVFIVQQLANLAALPPAGFRVGFFPLPLAGCSASPARVVAFLE